MVFFSCDNCGEALKKNQVEKHHSKCRFPTYSCMDCNKVFTAKTYSSHVKCISEDQKYGGKGFVPKENKGEVKQQTWSEQVEAAISNVKNKNLKNVLEKIRGFGNVPRKEAKFINFLQNSVKIRNPELCSLAWKYISEAAKSPQPNSNGAKVEESNMKSGVVPIEENNLQDKCSGKDMTADCSALSESNGVGNNEANSSTKRFKWRKAIKRTLEGSDNCSMKVKKLRKAVIEMYHTEGFEADEAQLKEIFEQKLASCGIVLDGKIARLS